MSKIATIYWLHLPEHTDMFSQGYIGVSTNLKKRLTNHKRRETKRKNKEFQNAF